MTGIWGNDEDYDMTITRVTPSAPRLTEKQFQQQIVDLAHLCGWKEYHTWLSIHSTAGFPDLVLLRGERLIFAELKSDRGVVTPAQQEWIDALRKVKGVEVYVWKPADWEQIERVLQRDGIT